MFDIAAHETTPPAPGDLELIQRFANLHEHVQGIEGQLPPSGEMLGWFLHERGLMPGASPLSDPDRETALELVRALHAMVRANQGEPMTDDDLAAIDGVARRAGLHPRFEREGPVLAPSAKGVDGALGRLVAIAFLAELDGSWEHLKECAYDGCASVFYDRSKNHSGRWCSMSACGNRAKVRAWRERHQVDVDA